MNPSPGRRRAAARRRGAGTRRADAPRPGPNGVPRLGPVWASWARAHAGILLLTLLAIPLRVVRITDRGLWVDEVVTLRLAEGNHFSLGEAHGVYFQLVRWSLALFGEGELALRLPSLILGVAAVPLIYLVGLELYGKREGLLAAAVIAGSNWLTLFSKEARFYTGFFAFTSLALWALLRVWRTGRLRDLALFLIALPLLRGMHPTAVIFVGVTVGWLVLWLAGSKPGRCAFWKGITWGTGAWSPRAAASLLALGLLGAAALWAAARLWQQYAHVVRSLSFSNRTPNVDFTAEFFLRHYGVFGLFHLPFAAPFVLPSVLQFAATVAGWTRGALRRPLFTSMTVTLLVVTFLLLFSYTTFQPYELKYSMFFFPPYLILLAGGVVAAADLAARLTPRSHRLAVQSLTIGFVAALSFAMGTAESLRALRKSFTGYKGAVAAAAAGYQPGDKVFAHDFGRGPVQYYAPRFGVAEADFIMLDQDKGEGEVEVARILAESEANRNLWVIASLEGRIQPRLRQFLIDHFDTIATRPSMWGEYYDVQLLGWRWAGRTVAGVGRQALSPPESPLSADAPSTVSLFVRRAGLYRLGVVAPAPIQVDGAEALTPPDLGEGSGGQRQLFQMRLERGPQRLSLRLPAVARKQVKVTDLEIEPDLTAGLTIEGEDASVFTSPGRFELRSIGDRSAIYYPVNCGAEYQIEAPSTGWLRLTLVGLNDAPGGILFEVLLDRDPQALLLLRGDVDQWTSATTVIAAEPGPHRLGVSFVGDVGTGLASEADLDGVLDRIEITAITAEERSLVEDQRLNPDEHLNAFGVEGDLPFPPVGSRLTTGETTWIPYQGGAARVERPGFDPAAPAIRIDMPPNGMAGTLSPPFPVEPGRLIYYDVEIATEFVINHTVGAGIAFLDAEGRLLRPHNFRFASLTGLCNNAHWTEGVNHGYERRWERFSACQVAPSEAAAAALAFVGYDNGYQPVKEGGRAWFRRAHVHPPDKIRTPP